MTITETHIEGLKIIEPRVFGDDRGYFYESYNVQTFMAAGIENNFVQDNQSASVKGVLRGLHYQRPPHGQAKLVRVLSGEVLDVAVDIREGSPTYGQWHSVRLSGENKKHFFIPRGFAHGFLTLSEHAVFAYKCDNFYNKESEGGLRYDDPKVGIDWEVAVENVLLSEKDAILPTLGNHLRFVDFTTETNK